MSKPDREAAVIDKIRTLPPDTLAEVEDFIDFLRDREKDERLVLAALRLSEESLAKIWNNPDDAANFDNL
jgi:hypothetical protein